MTLIYKWEKICSRFKKYPIDELRRLAEYEKVHLSPDMTKRQICALLAEKRVAKEQRQSEIQQATIPNCTNTSGLREEFEEIPPHLFYAFNQDKGTYCDNIQDLKTALIGSKTNPYTGVLFPQSVQTDIIEKNKYLDAALIKKHTDELSGEISRAFSQIDEEAIMSLRQATREVFDKFVKKLVEKDIITPSQQADILFISNLNLAKITMCRFIQDKKLAIEGQRELEGESGYYSRVYLRYFNLIEGASPVKFNKFVNDLVERGLRDCRDLNARTFPAQKNLLDDWSPDERSRAILVEPSSPDDLTVIQRNRVFRLVLNRHMHELSTLLDGAPADDESPEWFLYWRLKCLEDATCIQTFNDIILALPHCHNVFQNYLTRSEAERCLARVPFRHLQRIFVNPWTIRPILYYGTSEEKIETTTSLDGGFRAAGLPSFFGPLHGHCDRFFFQ